MARNTASTCVRQCDRSAKVTKLIAGFNAKILCKLFLLNPLFRVKKLEIIIIDTGALKAESHLQDL